LSYGKCPNRPIQIQPGQDRYEHLSVISIVPSSASTTGGSIPLPAPVPGAGTRRNHIHHLPPRHLLHQALRFHVQTNPRIYHLLVSVYRRVYRWLGPAPRLPTQPTLAWNARLGQTGVKPAVRTLEVRHTRAGKRYPPPIARPLGGLQWVVLARYNRACGSRCDPPARPWLWESHGSRSALSVI